MGWGWVDIPPCPPGYAPGRIVETNSKKPLLIWDSRANKYGAELVPDIFDVGMMAWAVRSKAKIWNMEDKCRILKPFCEPVMF